MLISDVDAELALAREKPPSPTAVQPHCSQGDKYIISTLLSRTAGGHQRYEHCQYSFRGRPVVIGWNNDTYFRAPNTRRASSPVSLA